MKTRALLFLAVALWSMGQRRLFGPVTSGISLLTLADVTWLGEYKRTPGGSANTCGDPATPAGGTQAGADQTIAVRYISGTRYIYGTVHCQFNGAPSLGRTWGDLIEYKEPTPGDGCAGGPYTGASPGSACALIETRRWAGWTNYDTWDSTYQDRNNGVQLSGIVFRQDDATVICWNLTGVYTQHNIPWVGCTQLLDTPNMTLGGDYYNVGTISGPWWYRSSMFTDVFWKATNNGWTWIPTEEQAAFGGMTILMPGAYGAVGGAGQLGPGLRAFKQLPTLSNTAFTVVPTSDTGGSNGIGVQLADYSEDFCGTGGVNLAHRPNDYITVKHPEHFDGWIGMYDPVGAIGYWLLSTDNLAGMAWVRTNSRNDLISFGRRSTDRASYTNGNPISLSVDPCASLTHVGATATMTCAHNTDHVNIGTTVTIACAQPALYQNHSFTVTGVSGDGFSFALDSDPGSDASWNSAGNDPLGNPCVGYGTPVRQAWRSDEVWTDLTRGNGNGYWSTDYTPTVWAMDPAQLKQSYAGTRDYCSTDFNGMHANAGGTNPRAIGNWKTQWPNIHVSIGDTGYMEGNDATSRKIMYEASGGLYFDRVTNQILWMYALSNPNDSTPMFHVFSVPN